MAADNLDPGQPENAPQEVIGPVQVNSFKRKDLHTKGMNSQNPAAHSQIPCSPRKTRTSAENQSIPRQGQKTDSADSDIYAHHTRPAATKSSPRGNGDQRFNSKFLQPSELWKNRDGPHQGRDRRGQFGEPCWWAKFNLSVTCCMSNSSIQYLSTQCKRNQRRNKHPLQGANMSSCIAP